jgi:hypothetical protein
MRLFYIRRAKEISKLCRTALNADKRGQGANFSEAMNKMSRADYFFRSTVKGTANKKPWNEKTLQGLILLVGCRGLEPRTDGLRDIRAIIKNQ